MASSAVVDGRWIRLVERLCDDGGCCYDASVTILTVIMVLWLIMVPYGLLEKRLEMIAGSFTFYDRCILRCFNRKLDNTRRYLFSRRVHKGSQATTNNLQQPAVSYGSGSAIAALARPPTMNTDSNSNAEKPPPPAAADGSMTVDQYYAQTLQAMDQLTNIFSFPSDLAQKAIEECGPEDVQVRLH